MFILLPEIIRCTGPSSPISSFSLAQGLCFCSFFTIWASLPPGVFSTLRVALYRSLYQPALVCLILFICLNSIISLFLQNDYLTHLISFSVMISYLSNAALVTFILKFLLCLDTFIQTLNDLIRSLFSVPSSTKAE